MRCPSNRTILSTQSHALSPLTVCLAAEAGTGMKTELHTFTTQKQQHSLSIFDIIYCQDDPWPLQQNKCFWSRAKYFQSLHSKFSNILKCFNSKNGNILKLMFSISVYLKFTQAHWRQVNSQWLKNKKQAIGQNKNYSRTYKFKIHLIFFISERSPAMRNLPQKNSAIWRGFI